MLGLARNVRQLVLPRGRAIWTWGSVPEVASTKGAPTWHRTRYFNEHFAKDTAPEWFTTHGQSLYSLIKADLEQLRSTDWTYGFSGYWDDLVENHREEFTTLYEPSCRRFSKALVGDFSEDVHATERNEIEKLLNELESTLELASRVEEVYTAIHDVRFKLEREVWDGFEREKLLAGLVDLVLRFQHDVPKEHRAKVKRELEAHVFSLRRNCPDIPNVKREFPDFMN
eukprot:TRINITY_DN99256_c0_g1_i1.p1 TRINITY_DN99256_c0_g1~~TRINITY_DN99256_c0_g1_i1.p1  ORF type:complete len:227 (-),score=25.56 TRINITY_DN99256_c0_g1_i1:73-753(-)